MTIAERLEALPLGFYEHISTNIGSCDIYYDLQLEYNFVNWIWEIWYYYDFFTEWCFEGELLEDVVSKLENRVKDNKHLFDQKT